MGKKIEKVARRNLYFDPALLEKYETLSAKTHIPVSDLMRMALEEYLRTAKFVTIAAKDVIGE